MGVTYDAGALVAADRGERRMWARHRALLELRQVPTVPAPVVGQGWRGGSRQARLARLLVGRKVERLDDDQARRVGELLAKAARTDVVDATVVEGALRRNDVVVSSAPLREADERPVTTRPGPLGHVVGTRSSPLALAEAVAQPDQDSCGGRDRRRSGDLALFRRALCQLSYPTADDGLSVAEQGPRVVPTARRGPDGI